MATTKFSPGDLEGTWIAATNMNADYTSAAFEMGAASEVAIQVIWTGANAVDGTFEIWGSVDGTNFEAYDDALYTAAAAAGNHTWRVLLGSIPYIQLVYLKVSNTAGSFTVKYRREMPV